MSESTCVEKLPHNCGSSDGMQVFHNEAAGHSAYCFACSTYVPDPYANGDRTPRTVSAKTDEDRLADVMDVLDLPTVALTSRKLRKETLEAFDVKVELSQQDGETPVVAYYPIMKGGELLGYKAKMQVEKKMWSVGRTKGEKDLFGWRQAVDNGGRRLFVTEGEDDALALYQALLDKQAGTKWESFLPSVVSIVGGSSSAAREIGRMLPAINAAFKEIVIVFDQDEAGQAAVKKVMQIAPNATSVTLTEKDANAMVIAGRSKALADAALFKSATPKNSRVVNAASLREEGKVQAEMGLSLPWPSLTKLTRGLRFGETIYIGAGVKQGKSTLRSALAAHFILEHKLDVFVAAPEESNVKTTQLLYGQVAGRVFHDPDVKLDVEAYDTAADWVGDKLKLINLYQLLDWPTLKLDILDAVGQGCRVVMIDPITNLTNGMAAADANTALQSIAQELSVIALDHDLIAIMFAHLKAAENGPAHERGGKVQSHQFAGSRAMMRSANMVIGLEGNRDPDLDEQERNQRRIVVLEDRQFGASGVVNVQYDHRSGLMRETRAYD